MTRIEGMPEKTSIDGTEKLPIGDTNQHITSQRIIDVAKAYADSLAANLGKRQTVRAATTAPITISTALNNADTLDGVTLATGNLVLVKDQAAPETNGIYVVGASPARFSQFDTYDEHPGALVIVQEGTANADTKWLCTSNVGGTLNTTAIDFAQDTAVSVAEDLTTAETDTTLVLAPDGLGGVEWRAETGGGGGGSNGAVAIFDHHADVGNVGTGEDDLYSDTVAAGQLATNDDKIFAEYGGVVVSSATATREIKAYFGGTMIFDTGVLTFASLSAAWTLKVLIIRVSSSVVRYECTFATEGTTLGDYTSAGEVTGLTLSSTNVLKITGEAASTGAATNDIVAKLGTVWYMPVAGGSVGSVHAYYQYLAAALEPDAIEPLQTGSFSYVVSGGATKLLLASFATKLGSTGRMEIRNPLRPLPIRGVTLAGLGSTSCAVIIDPTSPTYTNAWMTYFDRLQLLAETSLKSLDIVAPATNYPFLLGAYGAIILRAVNFDFDYISIQNNNSATGFNLMNETNDSEAQRYDSPMTLALNKFVATELYAGAERSGGVGKGTVVYILCPSTWSKIVDPNTYDFRDDFMGTSLDTSTKWTGAVSTAGNIQINTAYQWLKVLGTSTWGANGYNSQTSIARANGKKFVLDIYTGRNATANNSHIYGFTDGGVAGGGGPSFSNFSHGVLCTSSGAANILKVYENGNDRGTVGSGFADGTIYRIRITLGSSNDATYEIQGGAYGALGSASWTDITPGTTSSSTTPLYAGVSAGQTGTMYVSDARIY